MGYFETRQSTKIWIISPKDLDAMYEKTGSGTEIYLWVDTCTSETDDDIEPEKKKRKHSESSRRQNREDELEEIYGKLKAEHDDSYSSPQLKLWARMILCGTHEDYKDPPRVPMITGMPPKRQKKPDSFTEALTGAAEAVAKAFSPPPQPQPLAASMTNITATTSASCMGISPGKSTDLRMKNLQQLRVLQQLYEEKILSDSELVEQKKIILDVLRNLS